MQTQIQEIPIKAIEHNLKLIKNTENTIKRLKQKGVKEDNLEIRQYKHLKKKLTQDLLNLLEEFELPLQLVEV